MINPVRNINDVSISDVEQVKLTMSEHGVHLNKDTLESYQQALNPAVPFRQRIREFLKAENDLGKAAKVIKHGLILFTPFGKTIDTVDDFAKDILLPESQRTETPMIKWIKARLKEPGTYKALSTIAGLIGVSISPDLWKEIGTALVAVISLIQFIQKEREDDKEN